MDPAAECWDCRARIEARDNYCRHCGQGQGARVSWYYKPFGIVVCTVLGLGPFGLLLVRKAPLSGIWKWVLTAFVLAFTAFIAVGVIQLVHQVSAAMAVLRSGVLTGIPGF